MKSPYNIKHWSPVKKIPKSVDGWWNVLEWDDIDADEYGDNHIKLFYDVMNCFGTADLIPKDILFCEN